MLYQNLNYQIVKGTINSATPFEKRIPFDFFDNWDFATGFYLDVNSGTVTNGYFGFETDNDKTVKYLPIDFLKNNFSYLEKDKYFRDFFTLAKGRKAYLVFKGDSFANLEYSIVFRLENGAKKPVKTINYQTERRTVLSSATQLATEFLDIELDHDFENCTGIALVIPNSAQYQFAEFDLTIMTNDRTIILQPMKLKALGGQVGDLSNVAHDSRFFPIQLKAKGNKALLHFEKGYSNAYPNNMDIDIIFRLER